MPEWPSYGTFRKVTQTRIFWKTAKGHQVKFFKNRQKSYPRLKGQKTLWCKWHYPIISMPLNCQDWRRFWPKKRLQKCPNGQVMAIFARSHKPAFSEKVQRGDQRKFLKNSPRSQPRLKGPKAVWCKWYYPLTSMRLNCQDWKRFCRKKRLQKCPNGQVMAIYARSPKTRIFWKSAKGGPRF